MGLEVSNSIVEKCVLRMNGCTVDESLGPENEARVIFRVILSTHGDVNPPGTEKELQVLEGCLKFRTGCNELDDCLDRLLRQ